MITLPSGVRVWLACGHTDMGKPGDFWRSQALEQDPFGGALFACRGKRGCLVKLLWFDGQGVCLFSKRLEQGHFVWSSSNTGRVCLTPPQLSMSLECIDWRMPQRVIASICAVPPNTESKSLVPGGTDFVISCHNELLLQRILLVTATKREDWLVDQQDGACSMALFPDPLNLLGPRNVVVPV